MQFCCCEQCSFAHFIYQNRATTPISAVEANFQKIGTGNKEILLQGSLLRGFAIARTLLLTANTRGAMGSDNNYSFHNTATNAYPETWIFHETTQIQGSYHTSVKNSQFLLTRSEPSGWSHLYVINICGIYIFFSDMPSI